MLYKSSAGFSIVSLLLTVVIIGAMAWFVLSRISGTNDPEEGASKVIEQAQESVDKANDATEKADQILDKTNETVNSLRQ